MLSRERILIIEEEFLIALDIQRAVESAHALEAIFARNFAEASALSAQFSEFNLAIISGPRTASDADVAISLHAAGVAIVLCTAAPIELKGAWYDDVEEVSKPFRDADLLDACARAIERRNSRLA